ncbi:hypothetical protein LSAT2_013954 [Lamellibrachia satsuma]|nr:hypothetical protein LSAT2_013954 [Lamellibrachia satsuma]
MVLVRNTPVARRGSLRGDTMATEVSPRGTVAQRENLLPEYVPDLTGFTPRRMQQLATRRPPRSIVNIECNHFLRSSAEESIHGLPPLGYQLWLEAGKHSPPVPERPDSNYNSNVWRNFREEYGIRVGIA